MPAPPQATIFVEVNGKPQVEIVIHREWSTWDISLAGEDVREGVNEVSVRWPVPEFASEKALEKVRTNLFERELAEFYPIFGEIHSFTASDAQKVSNSFSIMEEEPAQVEV
jgi:hypothetical protein